MKSMRKFWREGALCRITGGNFSMNPYGPPPNYTNARWATVREGSAWARGYWWAAKHRAERQAP